ncbi:BGTF surface domain-containing protein [Saliphagus sp. GCM10025308]
MANDDQPEAYVGENVAIVNDDLAGDTVEIEAPDGTITRGLGADSHVRTLDTSGYEAGDQINVTFEEDGQTSTLTLDDLGLEIGDVSESYYDSDTIEVSAEADNIGLDVEFELLNSDGEAVATSEVKSLDSEGQASAEFDLSTIENLETGDYTVRVSEIDSGISDETDSFSVEEADANVAFDSSTYQAVSGDVGEITIQFEEGAEQATFNLVEEDENYEANVTVEDGNGDGEVTVLFNTYQAGHNGDTFTAEDDDDSVTIKDENSELGNAHLLPADFDLELFQGDSVDTGNEVDAAVLLLEARSTGDISTYVAPEDTAVDADIEDVIADMTESSTLAEDDVFVTQVEANGLYGYMLNSDGELVGDGLALNFTDTEDPRYGDADNIEVNDLIDADNAQIVTDAENETFYVVADLSSYEGANDESVDAGETWEVSFSVNSDNPYVTADEDEEVSSEFNVEERTLEFENVNDDDVVEIGNSAESEVATSTNVAPGTEVDFRLRFATSVMTETAEVGDDHRAVATFDLSDREVGEELDTVRATGAVNEQAEHAGVIVEAEDDSDDSLENWKATANLPEDAVEGDTLEFSVDLENNGDEEATTTVQLVFDGKNVIDAEETVGAGESVTLEGTDSKATADDYEWSLVVGDTVIDEGTLTVEEGEDTDGNDTDGDDTDGDDTDGDDTDGDDTDGDDTDGDDTDGDDTDGDDTDGDDTDGDDTDGDDTEDDDDDEGDDGSPGFGVAVALVALLGAAMLALRRQD